MTILIFEGHDNSGKSTIAKAYADRFGGRYYYNPTSKVLVNNNMPVTLQNYYLALHLPAFDQNRLHVIDRFVMSDYVYSEIFNTPKDDYWRHISYELSQPFVKYIVCYKTNTIKEDDVFDRQDEVRQKYLSFKNSEQWPNAFFLDTTDEDLEAQLAKIREVQNVL